MHFLGEIGGGWWNLHYADYFLLLTFGGIPWQVSYSYESNDSSVRTDGQTDIFLLCIIDINVKISYLSNFDFFF